MRNLLCRTSVSLAVVLLGILGLWKYAPLTIDDAFITYAYSKNAALGEGLVFNRGEHVEATSSMLWALLLVPFEFLGIGALLGSKILGALFFFASALLSFRAALHFLPQFPALHDRRCVASFAALLTVAAAAFPAWSIQGMENALVAFLLIAGLFLFALETQRRRGYWSCFPIALIGLARPEGFAFYGLFALLRVLIALGVRPIAWRWLGAWLIGLVLILVPYEVWGLGYYGTLLPNTVGAKVGGVDYARLVSGFEYLCGKASSQVFWLGALVIVVVGILSAARLLRRSGTSLDDSLAFLFPCALLIGLQLSFTIMTGGDWMIGGRFVSHLAPLLGASAVVCWGTLRSLSSMATRDVPTKSMWTVVSASLIGGYLFHGVSAFLYDRPIAEWVNQNSERAIDPIVERINRNAESTDVIACSDIGRIGYYYKGLVFDWWGLASPEVVSLGQAMGKIRPETVLSKKPRYIVLYGATPDLTTPEALGGFGGMSKPFIENEEFRAHYAPVLATQFTHGRHHILFERTTAARQLTTNALP